MIALLTDFGFEGPYVGLMHRVIKARVPSSVAVVDLMHDAPRFRPAEGGLLLGALLESLPRRCIVVAVVDPGVGSDRGALLARCGERWLVGPDNGLLAPALTREDSRAWDLPIGTPPSASFHGRDVFAPAAASLALGRMPAGVSDTYDWVGRAARDYGERVIYVDGFGNVMLGCTAEGRGPAAAPVVGGRPLPWARTFADRAPGEAFWYGNSLGLVEIAVNRGSAAADLDLAVGDSVPLGQARQ